MKDKIGAWLERLGNQFWPRPALVIVLSGALAAVLIRIDRTGWLAEGGRVPGWVYSGGESGARALLTAVASSTIGVAGTTFSITVAALSLASGQMGPRLLRNFVRDAGNQIALGTFLGTFVYALMVLRTVRAADENPFVPHLAVTGSMALAALCVGVLVWFVHHVATGINVETVIGLVHRDFCEAIRRLTDERTADGAEAGDLPDLRAARGDSVRSDRSGYVQAVDREALADWARASGGSIALTVRPGDFVSVGTPIARVTGGGEDAGPRVLASLVVGREPAATQDLEFSARQLVEVAVRALSPGINDPFTAATVLDHLGDGLCRLAPRRLRSGIVRTEGRILLQMPSTDYHGLCDTMFNPIRQNAATSAFVLIRLIDVLARAMEVETQPARRRELARHAGLAASAGRDGLADKGGLADLEDRYRDFAARHT